MLSGGVAYTYICIFWQILRKTLPRNARERYETRNAKCAHLLGLDTSGQSGAWPRGKQRANVTTNSVRKVCNAWEAGREQGGERGGGAYYI